MGFCTRWVGKLCTSSAPAGEPAAPGRSALPCFAAESARGGTLMSLPEGIAASTRELARACRGAGVLRSDIRVPEAKRGRVPCRNEEEHRPLKHSKPLEEIRGVAPSSASAGEAFRQPPRRRSPSPNRYRARASTAARSQPKQSHPRSRTVQCTSRPRHLRRPASCSRYP